MKTYAQIRKQWEDQEWELNFRWSVGDAKRAIEASKKAELLFNKMMQFPMINTIKNGQKESTSKKNKTQLYA